MPGYYLKQYQSQAGKEMKIMPYIPPSVVQEVKRMDLLTYLKNYEPYELVHFSGNTYTTRTHDSLKISNGKWMWWSRGIGGRSALDYLIKGKRLNFRYDRKNPRLLSSSRSTLVIPISCNFSSVVRERFKFCVNRKN